MNCKLSFSLDAFKGRIVTSNAVLKLKNASLSLWVANVVLSNNFRIRCFLNSETVAKTVINRLFSPGSILSPFCGARMMPIRPSTVARYAVASKNPPQLTDTIILADKVHAALVSLSNGSSIFTGCDEQGRPLQGNRHAHVFCESNNGLGKGIDGEITHITIYAPTGFESEDQRALQDLNRVWGGDDLEIQVILLGFGQPQDFGGQDLERGQCPLLARSRAGSLARPSCPRATPRSRGRARSSGTRAACRSGARSTSWGGCWGWRAFRSRWRWSPWASPGWAIEDIHDCNGERSTVLAGRGLERRPPVAREARRPTPAAVRRK